MDNRQNLFYALGVFAYAIAKADGKIQFEETQELHKIVKEEMSHDMDFNYVEIIFKILQKDKVGFEQVHQWVLVALEQGKCYLTDKIKTQFTTVLMRVADSFPPKEAEEHDRINQLIQEINDFKVNMTIE
ncbi:MAG: hypothetical protein ACI857_000611 [Arenicella sp.]|jgi:hypothetical protein